MEQRSKRREAGLSAGLPPLVAVVFLTVPAGFWVGKSTMEPREVLEPDGQALAQNAAGKGVDPGERLAETPRIAGSKARTPFPLRIGGTSEDDGAKSISPSEIWNRESCPVPAVQIEKSEGCESGHDYPSCRWRVPSAGRADRIYDIWRNTTEEHRWGRPALVRLLLAVASEYSRSYPGELLAIGDLDAPGPRHNTHDNGVDADLYLPGTMLVENLGGGEYADNYGLRSQLERRMLEARVEFLARALAACSNGKVRIYYNDQNVRTRFLRWYQQQGFRSALGPPMQAHNELHDFHFHVTIPENLGTPSSQGRRDI